MTLNDLRQRHKSLVDEMRAITAAPAGEDLSHDQEADLAALEGKVVKLEKRIAAQEFADARDLAARGNPLNGAGPSRPELRVFAHAATPAPNGFDGAVMIAQDGSRVPVLASQDKLADFVSAEQRNDSPSLGGFLRSVYFGASTPAEKRDLAEASVGSGGAVVPTPLAAGILDLMRAKSVAFRAGARTIPMTSQTLKFARLIRAPIGAWRAEAAPIAQDDAAFDQVTLTAKSWALLTKISRELLEDGQNVDAILRDTFASSAALALDQAILYGIGTNNQPLGVANTPGIQAVSMGANGGPLTSSAKLLDAVLALENANAGTITGMVAAPRTARAVAAFADTTGQPILLPPRLANVPFLTTTSASVAETQGTNNASSSIILGDFSEIYVGLRTSLQISTLSERYADTGQIAFVSWLRADVLVAHPAAMAKISGITG